MDRGAWWATVHGVTELDMTELHTLLFFHSDIWKSWFMQLPSLNTPPLSIKHQLFIMVCKSLCDGSTTLVSKNISHMGHPVHPAQVTSFFLLSP